MIRPFRQLVSAFVGGVSLLAGVAIAPSVSANSVWDDSTLNAIIERGTLRVGLEAGYMPFEMRDKRGRIIGFDVDIARHMARAMGVELELVNTAWDGIIPALLTDKFDLLMSGMTITPQRNLQVNFADPYMVIGQSVILRESLAGEISDYRDLNNPKYTVVSKLGTTGEITARRFMSKADILTFETESEAVLEVRNNRADAFVYDLPYNIVYIAQNPDKLVHLDEPFTYEPLGWAIRKGDPDFLNWLNNYLRQIKGDGTYDALYERWFKSDQWLRQVNE